MSNGICILGYCPYTVPYVEEAYKISCEKECPYWVAVDTEEEISR